MANQVAQHTRRMAAYMALAGGALVLLFWALYFSGAIAPGGDDPSVKGFETAFPFADTILGVVLIAAAVGLLRGRAFGSFLLVVGASMALYLGVLDVTFYAHQGTYARLTISNAAELLINAACVSGGAAGLYIGWRMWQCY